MKTTKEPCTDAFCPLCSFAAHAYYAHPDASIYECGACSHVFTDPESVRTHEPYSASYFSDDHKNWFSNPNVRLFSWIASQIPRGATSLLDVGCGNGDFLRFLRTQRQDLSLTGIDLTCPARESEGITFIKDDFIQSNALGTYDAIVSLATIEHMTYLNDYLHRIREVLKDRGRFIVTTIDNRSALYRIARLASKAGFRMAINRLYSPHHLHHFTAESLQCALLRNNFKVTSRASHNVPLRAIDVPVSNRLIKVILLTAVALAFGAGVLTRAGFQQTLVCMKATDLE